jgi:hypothetical protein
MVERFKPEQSEQAEPPYWQEAVEVGNVEINGDPLPLYLRLHIVEERFSGRKHELGVELSEQRGQRMYVHGRPSIIEPEITLQIGLYDTPASDGSIGQVEGTSYEGVRWREVGNAQAWYYPADKWIMLWECFLNDWYRQETPQDDKALSQLWDGFERMLLERFSEATRLVTPNWENIYDKAAWHSFLEARGYHPLTDQAMVKQRSFSA